MIDRGLSMIDHGPKYRPEIGALENVRQEVVLGSIQLQKCFRCHRDHRYFNELKRGVVKLQSFVRGVNAKRQYDTLIKLRQQVQSKLHEEQLTAATRLQCVIRGWLARREFNHLHRSVKKDVAKSNSRCRHGWKILNGEDLQMEDIQNPSLVEELQARVSKAEAALGQKEEENAALQKQLQQFEARWSDHENSMKSMESRWQKQIEVLQMSLAAAKKSLASDNTTDQHKRQQDGTTSPPYYDTEDILPMGAQTPGGQTPPIKYPSAETKSNTNVVNQLEKEFEQQKQDFEDKAKAIEAKAQPQVASQKDVDEIRKLKVKFVNWKKDYKVRLKETKLKLLKLSNSEADKGLQGFRKWWAIKTKNFLV
ncbi:hypothetical protein LguiB_002963 [Lonicera macranthoides]